MGSTGGGGGFRIALAGEKVALRRLGVTLAGEKVALRRLGGGACWGEGRAQGASGDVS